MPPPRWLARLTIPMLAGAALVTNAAIATADPTSDAYLAQLRAVGFTWPSDHDEALIGMAHLISDDLGWGWTYGRVPAHPRHLGPEKRYVRTGHIHDRSRTFDLLPQPAVLGTPLLSGPGPT